MSFGHPKSRKLKLAALVRQRAARIRKLLERKLLVSPNEVPEHAIPLDPDRSTKAKLLCPPAYYEDIDYDCIDCGMRAVWRAETQQHYFEILQKSPYRRAVRCPECQALRKHRGGG
jgi:DNA-directed RNA polymerase subunit RPC12/RpoP